MKQNNKKQVYVAPAVEANVVNVENGFSMSLVLNCQLDGYQTELIETLTTVGM